MSSTELIKRGWKQDENIRQHINQTMREGYRWNGTTLYFSTKLNGKIIEHGVKPE